MTAFTILATTVGFVPATPAGASETHECVETLPAGTYGDVRVSAGESCIFDDGVVIEGNFEARDAVNIVTAGATVHGNVTIDGATGFVHVVSGLGVGETTHIYGNVTIKNTDQSDIGPDDYGLIYVGGRPLGDGPPPPGEPIPHSTLHIHGNLLLKDNTVFDFSAGNLFSKLIVDGNVTVKGNVLSDLDLHVYAMDIGGDLTVKRNTAQAFTSVLCNNVDGNVVIDRNHNPGVDPGFGPPGAVWAQVQVMTNCADVIFPEIPIGNAKVSGNLTVTRNTSGDGNNDFAQIAIFATTVDGNLTVSRNAVNAAAPSNDTFLTIEGSDVGGNLTCSRNSIDPVQDRFGFGPNVVAGNDTCFGDD